MPDAPISIHGEYHNPLTNPTDAVRTPRKEPNKPNQQRKERKTGCESAYYLPLSQHAEWKKCPLLASRASAWGRVQRTALSPALHAREALS